MREPEFFIAGAPKCGTTSLYRWLKQHPDVFLPDLKEPHYYSRDLPGLREVTTAEAYADLYAAAPENALKGEASASYLQSETAVREILEGNTKARFIVVLRDPVQMAHALHGELLANLSEDVEDFARAWRLQLDRTVGSHLPPRTREPQMLQYRNVCAIGAQLKRFFALVPENQRFVLLTDDMREDGPAVHARLLEFLDLPPAPLQEFDRANASHRVRSRRLAALHRDLPALLGPVYGPAKRLGNAIGLRPSALVARFNRQETPRKSLSPEFEAELRAVFAEEVMEVERLLGRALPTWRATPEVTV